MSVVTVDAMIADSAARREVPVTGHPAVGAVVVVAGLRAVALPAQLDRLGHRDLRTVGEMQRRLITEHVARRAAQRAVLKGQPLVKLVEGRRRRGQRIGLPHRVAGHARDAHRTAERILRSGRDAGQPIGGMNRDRSSRRARCGSRAR